MAALSAPLPAAVGTTAGLRWALLAGNFAIGCGVMVVAGSLNDLVRSLQVSVPAGGQLITVAALVMALGAPLVAAAVGGWDRRRTGQACAGARKEQQSRRQNIDVGRNALQHHSQLR